MRTLLRLIDLQTIVGRALGRLQPLFLLASRFYVGWQFTKSGWLKYTSWDSTLSLFQYEYQVPVLPPHAAAIAGTFGELFFPVLMYLGFFGRFGAIGTFFVNVVAVVSYRQVLLAPGFEAALGNHILWGFMLLMLCITGPGSISLDHWLERRSAQGRDR